MILVLIVVAYGLVWLVVGGMVLAALAALVPVVLVLSLFALIGACVRPRGGSR